MRMLTSALMVATLSASLTACGGATWLDVGGTTGGGGVAMGTSVTGTATATVSAPTTGSVVTENQLRAEWTSQTLEDRTRLTGQVYNGWVMWARDIMLLVDSFDAAGQVVRRTQVRLWRVVGPGASSYFDVNVPTAASYRVQVVGVRWLTDEELKW